MARGTAPGSFPRDLPLFRHQLPQRPIDSRLVASSLPLEPGQNVGIQTQRHCLLDRPAVSQPLRRRSRRTLSPARGSLHPSNFPVPRNPFPLFHMRSLYVYSSTYNIASTVFHVEHISILDGGPKLRKPPVILVPTLKGNPRYTSSLEWPTCPTRRGKSQASSGCGIPP